MTREEARKAAEIMLAYADGKEIEFFIKGGRKWSRAIEPTFDWCDTNYRIKPSPTYRPFKNAEECWQEMQKHQPFGWLQDKDCKSFKYYVLSIAEDGVVTTDYESDIRYLSYETTGLNCTFADGTPFGIKEE